MEEVFCSKSDRFGDFPLSPFLPPLLRFGWANCGGGNRHRGRKRKKRNGEAKREKSKQKQKGEKGGGNVRSLWWLIIFSLCLSSYVRDAPPSFIPTWPNKTSRRKEKDEIYAFSALFSLPLPPFQVACQKRLFRRRYSSRIERKADIQSHYSTYGRRNKLWTSSKDKVHSKKMECVKRIPKFKNTLVKQTSKKETC